jgi:hypothetical protein
MDWTDTLNLREAGHVDGFRNPNEPERGADVDEDVAPAAPPTHKAITSRDAPAVGPTRRAAEKSAKKSAKKR